MDMDEYERLKYWAAKHDVSINDYIRDSIQFMIRYENKDYDLAPLEIQRLNQLVDVITTLSSDVKSLEDIAVSGFDSLLNLTRGDNYLLEGEDGNI